MYHWLVACTWFYHIEAVEAVLNHEAFNLDELLISAPHCSHMVQLLQEELDGHGHRLLSHTKKQVEALFHQSDTDQLLRDLLRLFIEQTDHESAGIGNHLSSVWQERSAEVSKLISCWSEYLKTQGKDCLHADAEGHRAD